MKIILLFFILIYALPGSTKELSLQQQDDINQQAIILVKNLFDKIINEQGFSQVEEERFFGKHGGILGESVYKSLGSDFKRNKFIANILFASQQFNTPLSILLVKKLNGLLKDKKRFSFAIAHNVQTLDSKNIPRNGINASKLLFVRAIPDTDNKFFHDIANGINFIFSLHYDSIARKAVYIDLVNSYVGNDPMYTVLGFNGNFASDLKLTPSTLIFLKKTIESEY